MQYILIAILIVITLIIKEVRLELNVRKKVHKDAILDIAFMESREKGLLKEQNGPGAYVLTNMSTGRSYVGQSVRIVDRVNAHLTGSGNGDVYADLKNGDRFSIRLISLYDTHYKDLNSLEKFLIGVHDSYRNGYNRTRGNA